MTQIKFFLFIFSTLFSEILLFECGKAKLGVGNVIGGSDVNPHQFPWHAAMLRNSGNKYSFHCGAVIISKSQLLTAAHCIQNKERNLKYLPRDFRILIGVHDLNNQFEIGKEIRSVKKILVHPDWNPDTANFDGDISIIILEQEINFNNYIQPICLWESGSSPSASSGIIVGYGKSEDVTKIHENVPKKLNVPIHSQADCFLTNPQLATISSRRTFCAGSGSGTGACVGDSGSGLYILSSGTFYLRGIVSSSLRKDSSCDVDTYSVFTDVLQYKNWIRLDLPDDECGTMSSSSGLIQKGYFANRKEFPWMVLVDGVFDTSGVLISHKHVVTFSPSVANWNDDKKKHLAISANDVQITFSAVRTDDENLLKIKASRIILHPEHRYENDLPVISIAIVVLSKPVVFNEYIKPICLWGLNQDADITDGSVLYAVGYGNGATGVIENVRKYAKVTKVSEKRCRESYSTKLYYMRMSKAFCVIGSDNDGQPCHRDESIFIKYNGRWFFRGFSVTRKTLPSNPNICSLEPILYEDAAQYSQWLQSFLAD